MDERAARRTVVTALGRADRPVTPDELLLIPEVEAAVDHTGALYAHLAHLVAVGVADRRPSPRGPRFRLVEGGPTASDAARFAPLADGGEDPPLP